MSITPFSWCAGPAGKGDQSARQSFALRPDETGEIAQIIGRTEEYACNIVRIHLGTQARQTLFAFSFRPFQQAQRKIQVRRATVLLPGVLLPAFLCSFWDIYQCPILNAGCTELRHAAHRR